MIHDLAADLESSLSLSLTRAGSESRVVEVVVSRNGIKKALDIKNGGKPHQVMHGFCSLGSCNLHSCISRSRLEVVPPDVRRFEPNP